MNARPIPDGYRTITPSAAMYDCETAIAYYKEAFGAEERMRFAGPDGKVMHCELQIGDSIFMLGEPMDKPYAMHAMLYVEDCDAVFRRAVKSGGTVKQHPTDQFYGDRTGSVVDPFGNEWHISTHIEDVSEDEMHRRWEALMAKDQAAE